VKQISGMRDTYDRLAELVSKYNIDKKDVVFLATLVTRIGMLEGKAKANEKTITELETSNAELVRRVKTLDIVINHMNDWMQEIDEVITPYVPGRKLHSIGFRPVVHPDVVRDVLERLQRNGE